MRLGKPFRSLALAGPATRLVQTPCLGQTLHATPGARVAVFARVPAARAMAVCGDALYVGTKGNAVYGASLAGAPAVRAASGLVALNGVTCLGSRLYAASRDRLSAFTPAPGGTLANRADLPIRLLSQAHHGLRYIHAKGLLRTTSGTDGASPESLEPSVFLGEVAEWFIASAATTSLDPAPLDQAFTSSRDPWEGACFSKQRRRDFGLRQAWAPAQERFDLVSNRHVQPSSS